MSQGHLLLASHDPLRVLHTGLSGEGGPLDHSGDVSRRGYATCSRRWGAGHGRTEAPRVLPTLTEQQQSARMKRGAKSNHPHPPHGKNTEVSYSQTGS